jgi:5-hydroxyisourate hydrolase-like protein (transthyretin family)
MRTNKIPEGLFSSLEEKENKRFETLRNKYTKILKVIESKKLSSINKKFISNNKHTKDLHFSQENFTLLFRIARESYNRGKYADSLKILEMLFVVFEEELPDSLQFYWAKVLSYVALVLSKGTTALGANMNGSKRRFKRDRLSLWSEICKKEKELSTFNLALQKEVIDIKMKFFHIKIVLDYVIRKKHLLGRNKTETMEETPRKMSRKKSRRKSTRKMTHNTGDEGDEMDRKDSELAEIAEVDTKMGKCLQLMMKDIKLENFDWKEEEMRNMLVYIFILEVNLEEISKLKDMSKSQLVRGFREMWFYVKEYLSEKSNNSLYSFMESLYIQFDFEESAQHLKNIVKQIDNDWIFQNYKGEIYNQLLKMFVIVYKKVTEKVDKTFLENILNIEVNDLDELLSNSGNNSSELKEVEQTQVERLQTYLKSAQALKKQLA